MSMNSADTSADQSVEQDHHRPFWVLPTSEVNGFMVSAIERFLWPIEVASCLADEIGINGSIATREEQLLNTGMVIAALETLRAFADTTLTGRSALWQTSYVRRANKARQLGLGFKKSMAALGTVWLVPNQVIWNGTMPCFTPDFLQRSALVNDRLKRSLLRGHMAIDTLVSEDRVAAAFRALLHEDLDRGLETGAELCVQAYVKELYDTLADRWRVWLGERYQRNNGTAGSRRLPSFQATRTQILANLDPLAREGLRGLDQRLIRRIIPLPHIVRVRTSRTGGRSNSAWARIHSSDDANRWTDWIEPLFAVEDSSTKKAWDGKPYRRHIRRLHAMVESEVDANAAERFAEEIVRVAGSKLWIVHQFDCNTWSIMIKPDRRNTEERQIQIRATDLLQRTGFWVPLFGGTAGRCLATWKQKRQDDPEERCRNTQRAHGRASTAMKAAAPAAVRVFTVTDGDVTDSDYVPESLADFGLDRLDHAIELYREAGIEFEEE